MLGGDSSDKRYPMTNGKKPELPWHQIIDDCSDCKEKLMIEECLTNTDGQFLFTTVCFRCGKKEHIILTDKYIKSVCYDLDLLSSVMIKH